MQAVPFLVLEKLWWHHGVLPDVLLALCSTVCAQEKKRSVSLDFVSMPLGQTLGLIGVR